MQKAQSDVSKEHRRSFSVPKIDKDDIANDNFTIGPSLNERNAEIETPKDEISSLSNVVSHTLNKLLRWSPKPMHRKRSEAGNSQDSTGSDYSVSSEMNGESPGGKSYSPSYSKRASCPTFHADETDERLKVISTAKEGNGLEREIILEQSSNDDLGITMTAPDKVEESSKFTLGEHRRSASSGKEDASPIKRTSSLKINKSESKSDSASRSSAEHLHLSHMHSRERSFEKSLDNIIDKCSSDKSLDAGLGQENSSKNGVISDTNKTDDQSSKKKKKSGPWYTIWNTSYKSRSEEFKKLFREIPHDERLIVDYSCALQKDILVHGRMFISQNWLCFYANIFRWETTLTIPMKKITAVTKERTARVIPNAIQVAMEKEKYFFTSFGARDKTYLMLFRIWQNALLDQPMSPKELWQWVHLSYGDELGLTSSDDDYIAPSQEEEEDPTGEEGNSVSKDLEASSLLSTGSEVMANQDILFEDDQEGAAVDTIPTDLSDTTESEAEEFLCAADHTHLAKEPLNCIYNVPVDQLFSMLFGDGKSDLLKRTHAQKNNQNVRITNWEEDPSDGNKHRTVSYLLALNYSIGPKSSETVEQQTLYKVSEPGKFYLIDSESSMAGIPYGDSFNVLNRFCLTRFGKNKCRFRLTTEVKYKKSVWRVTKNLIEKNSLHGCTDFFSTLDSHLKHEKVQETTDILHTHAMSLKRKVRKRRVRTGPSVVDTGLHKGTKPSMARHLSLMERKQNVTSSSHAFLPTEEKASKMNVQLLTRIIFVTLIFLVIFNAILFYKLWYLETLTSNIYTPLRDDPAQDSSRSPEEWTRLLKQQQYLHEQEIDKWKEILSSSITLIDQMKSTLSQLRDSLDQRYHAQTKYTDSSS